MLLSRAISRISAPSRRLFSTASDPGYSNIIWSTVGKNDSVSLIKLNRPEALNALNSELFKELNGYPSRAFAAGADIKEMATKTYPEVIRENFLKNWTRITEMGKPTIAAVNGFALGGGCELAMMCDIILASPNAKFGQPEINLGVIPGSGGTQRLLRVIGKSRTMELVLTGRNFTAEEASSWGLISRVVPDGEGDEKGEGVVKEAIKMAETIAEKPELAVRMAKECVDAGYELTLSQGLKFERRLFHSLFSTEDQKEGMAAFAEKRKAQFKGN